MEMYDIVKRLAALAKTPLTESKTAEAFDTEVKTNPRERGKYAFKDVHELKKELTRVKRQMADYKDHGKTVPHALRGKFSELTFAIRAKQADGGKWGAINETDLEEAGCGAMESDLDEMFHFDVPSGKDRGPRDHGTDELARRAEFSKRTKQPIALEPGYKDKGHYGDMYKIAGPKGRLPEGEMDEGNEFSGALAQARKTGSATFKVDGRTYKVTEAELDEANKETKKDFKARQERLAAASAQTEKDPARLARLSKIPGYTAAMDSAKKTTQKEEAKLDEREFDTKEKFDRDARPGDTYRGHKGTITKTRSGETHRRRHADDDHADDKEDDDKDDKKEKRSRGRPKGTKGKTGARGPSGRSKLLKMDEGADDLHDSGEYDREGEMAKQQLHTVDSAAKELHAILDDEENLPEWVQSKITKAMDYLDTVRDYMSGRDAEDAEDAEILPEKAVSRSQQQAAGIALAAKRKGKTPPGQGAAAEMSKMPAKELEKFAKTKHKGLPGKKKQEAVEETTVAGSVATSTAEPAKKGKKGMQFGKGVYEGKLEENFNRKLSTVLSESMTVNASISSEGGQNLTVTATDEDAQALAQLLNLAGMQSSGYESACPACGQQHCGCDTVEEDYANAPDIVTADEDYMVNTLSGGLNGRKSTGQTTLPIINRDARRQGIQSVAEDVTEQQQSRLWDLYKRIK